VVSAHTDTVFPLDTDLTVRFEYGNESGQDIIFGPGLADNSLGVAGLLKLAETLRDYGLVPSSDIWFVANVCEEGLGDLRGMRAVVQQFGQAAAYIVVEGGSFGSIFHQAIGVRRFRLDVSTPGGHSWGDFGQPSAVHILSRIVTALDDIELPKRPKTSINVGIIDGGTSVNTIAASASCLIDCRSAGSENLLTLVASVEDIAAEADRQVDVTVNLQEIGNRPAGKVPADDPPASWAAEALKRVGFKHAVFMAGSTDANIPISLDLPAVCIGLARSSNTHRLDEYLDPAYLPQGMGQLLLVALAAAGFDERNE
jgi:acetylornithine deacetylase/succinyl-diaminopimelate desuccinylase-like protein